MHRLEKGSFQWPIASEASFNAMIVHAEMFTNIDETPGNSTHCDNEVASSVSGRLFSSSPTNVQRPSMLQAFVTFSTTVVPRCVVWPPICFKAIRTFTKSIKKILKLSQSFTRPNASTSIILELFRVWIVAALKHGVPRPVSSAFKSFAIVTMFIRHSIGSFNVVLAAGWQRLLSARRDSTKLPSASQSNLCESFA